MSKSSTATLPKNPPQLSSKSAWSKGPPASSSRSQSPAPSAQPPAHATHSRRPSALGPNIPIKDGVGISRSVGATTKPGGPSVSFGSIDSDASAPMSSSPAPPTPTPPIKSEGVKSFGTVLAAPSEVNGKSAVQTTATIPPAASASASAPKKSINKADIAKLFQGSSSASTSTPSQPSSPSVRPSSIASPPSSSSQIPPAQPFQSFVPQNGMRPPPQNQGPNSASGSGPKSPPYRHQAPNAAGSRMSNGPNGSGQMSGNMGSPRLSAHPPPANMQQPPMPQQMQWSGYGYMYPQPGMDPGYMSQYGWYVPGQMPHQPPHGVPPPNGMPMSPRNPPLPMPAGPGTPSPSHASPASHTSPPPMQHSSSGSISSIASSPPTPASNQARYNPNANAFVPRQSKVSISLKSTDGKEIDLQHFKHQSPAQPAHVLPPVSSPAPASPNRRSQIRIESEADRKKRLQAEFDEQKAKQKERQEIEAKAKKEKEEKEKVEQDKKEAEDKAARDQQEAEERRLREEQEAKRKEEEQEAERRRSEEEKEAERRRKSEEEATKKREEEEASKKAQAEAEAQRQAEEQAAIAEAKRKAEAEAAQPEPVESEAQVTEEPEEGEVVETTDEKDDQAEKKIPLTIDTATPSELQRRRPGPLDLSGANKPNIPPPLPSALATARIISDLGSVSYPEGVKSPNVELNVGAKDGKFRYDREFLLQFMSVCKEKPDNLPPLDAIGLDPTDPPNYPMSRGGSGRHRPSSSTSAPQRQPSVSGAFPGSSFSKSAANPFSMGNFSTLPSSKLTSEERFNRAASVSGPNFPRSSQVQRTASQGGPGAAPMGSNRVRSKRGEKRNDGNKAPSSHQQSSGGYASAAALAQAMLEPVAPLQQSANRWDRKVLATDHDSPEMVDRKVKGLLNKLTMEKFDSISDQIISWANKSEKEKDGRTLIQVIRLVFEKATDEAAWSEMYARLCRKMMEQISPKVQDDGIKNAEGKPIAGGQLFRKYLLNRCQEDFERGWVAKEAAAAAAANKASEDDATKKENEKKSGVEGTDGEHALYSEEYYIAQKAKRQGLGLIKFIGELFKLQMLTERIMHECVKKLLGNVENPEEEEIESLCKLLSTVGAMLDTAKARAHMDVYFSRMKELTKSNNVSSRMQFMLQDVLELRERRWINRNAVAAPTTLAAVHELAAKEKAAADKESYNRTISMSRGGSRRGGDRGEPPHVGPDGWAVAGGSAPRPPPKAGDLSKFGQINKGSGAPLTFGPQSSIYSGKKDKRESLQRTNSSSSNMFSMLQHSEAAAEPVLTDTPLQRRKLVLQPRSKPVEESSSSAAPESERGSDVEVESPAAEAPAMSDAEAKKKIDEDVKEFFAVRNLEEADSYFERLPAGHHHSLVDKLVSLAIESKDADAQLVADFFKRAKGKGLCESSAFEQGFLPIAEFLDDIAIDAPMAYRLMATMMAGAGFNEEERTRIASKLPENSSKLLDLLS